MKRKSIIAGLRIIALFLAAGALTDLASPADKGVRVVDTDAPKPAPAKNSDEAMARGKSFLVQQLEALLDGTTKADGILANYQEGLVAFMAWTLLECGVSAEDPIIVKAAVKLRERYAGLNRIYSLAATIFFFDRFDDKHNKDVIQTCAVQLMAGQNASGAWEYECDRLSKADEQLLLALANSSSTRSATRTGIRGHRSCCYSRSAPMAAGRMFFPPTVDTCFALLILKRVNAVPDLNIKKLVNIKNPEASDK